MASVGYAVRKYVAILSPTVSVMLNWFDDAHISLRLCAGNDGRVLVTRSFTSQRDALCWLTSPVYKEAVATTANLTEELAPVANSPTAFIAVLSSSSRSCFPTSSAGLASVLALVQDPSNGACICGTFATEPIAWEWLDNNAGPALLEVVGGFIDAPEGAAGSGRPTQPVAGSPASPSMSGSVASSSPLGLRLTSPFGRPAPGVTSRAKESATTQVSEGGRLPRRFGALAAPLLPSKRAASPTTADPSSLASFAGLGDRLMQDEPPSSSVPHGNRGVDGSCCGLEKRRKLAATEPADVDVPLHEVSSGGDDTESLLSPPDLDEWVYSNDSTQDADGLELRALLRSSDRRYRRATTSSRDTASGSRGDGGRAADRGVGGQARSTSNPSPARGPTVLSSRAAGGRAAPSSVGRPTRSPTDRGQIGDLAAVGHWDAVCEQLFARIQSAFISGGPGAGKSTLLRRLHAFLRERYPLDGEVVVLAPTGTSAKTAGGVTFHSFFGFIRDYEPSGDAAGKARRLLSNRRYAPIKERLRRVRAILLDEVSMVSGNKMGVMHALLSQARSESARPCLWYAFGDFFQLGPVKGAAMAFTAPCWRTLFGDAYLDLPGAFRQRDPEFTRAVRDARVGVVSSAVERLVADSWLEGPAYEAMKTKVFHLMPRHKDVVAHNRACLHALTAGSEPQLYKAVDSVDVDPDRDTSLAMPILSAVPELSRKAALSDCVAPVAVPHCLNARVMIISNHKQPLGVCHGSVGFISSYQDDGTAVVRLENHILPPGMERGSYGLLDAGETWVEVACPPLKFSARIYSFPGALAVRNQVPFVLGWASTIHMSQSLSISRAVLDLSHCFEAGMVQTAISRVPTKKGLYIKSFCASRVYANPQVIKMYSEWRRL